MDGIRKVLTTVAIVTVTATQAAFAQGPLVSTGSSNDGVNDLRWDVAVRPHATSDIFTYFAPTAFTDAFLVDVDPGTPGYQIPGSWQPNTGTYMWIGASPSASLPNGGNQGQSVYDYLFRIIFDYPSAVTASFYCAKDNTVGSYSLNGGPAVTGGCDGTRAFVFGPEQMITANGGPNTLYFAVEGDGTTDGLLVNVTRVTPTPEPASLTLLATGLVGIVGAARRRRQGRAG